MNCQHTMPISPAAARASAQSVAVQVQVVAFCKLCSLKTELSLSKRGPFARNVDAPARWQHQQQLDHLTCEYLPGLQGVVCDLARHSSPRVLRGFDKCATRFKPSLSSDSSCGVFPSAGTAMPKLRNLNAVLKCTGNAKRHMDELREHRATIHVNILEARRCSQCSLRRFV